MAGREGAAAAVARTPGAGAEPAQVAESVGQAAASSQAAELQAAALAGESEGGSAAATPSAPGDASVAQGNEIQGTPAEPSGGLGLGALLQQFLTTLNEAVQTALNPPHVVEAGETLSKIAADRYGDARLWRGIYQANRSVIGNDPNVIYPGQELAMPSLDEIIETNTHRLTVQVAFEKRWNVDVDREAGAGQVPVETFRRMNAELKLLPPDHVQGTWTRLLHLNDSAGAYMGGGEFGLGEDAVTTGDQRFGTELVLVDAITAGDTTFKLDPTALIGPGVSATIGDGADAETVAITAVDGGKETFTVSTAFTKAHAAGDTVINAANAPRDVPWLEAVVRHEIAHAIDGPLVDTSTFTQGLGDWHTTATFNDWAARMGTPWATNDGTVITDAEKTQIQTVIDGLLTAPSTAGLDDGLDATHPILTHWSKDVPVIEAAKPMADTGSDYWQYSENYFGTNGRFFTINDYYGEYHSFNSQVQYNQVRSYATYSPAEFFAEVYTVYYEQAADPAATPGALVPVGAWKSWFDANVATAAPVDAAAGAAGGPSAGKAAGRSTA